MDVTDVKKLAKKTARKAEAWAQRESPITRLRDTAEHADETLRQFAKEQPMVAVGVAVLAGYLVGRAVARIS